MKVQKIVKDHFKNRKFARITRRISKNKTRISRGYILDLNKRFVLLQESDDFRMLGKTIFQRKKISNIRYNKDDNYYDKIMEWEGEKKKLDFSTKIKLNSWVEILESLRRTSKLIIIECEKEENNSFIIGEIEKIKSKSVYIRYFDATGVFESELTKIRYKSITKITFDDRYINVFSKYLR